MKVITKTFSFAAFRARAIEDKTIPPRDLAGFLAYPPIQRLAADGDIADLGVFLKLSFQYRRGVRRGAFRHQEVLKWPAAIGNKAVPLYFMRDLEFPEEDTDAIEIFAHLWKANYTGQHQMEGGRVFVVAKKLQQRVSRIETVAVKHLREIESLAEEVAGGARFWKLQDQETGEVEFTLSEDD